MHGSLISSLIPKNWEQYLQGEFAPSLQAPPVFNTILNNLKCL